MTALTSALYSMTQAPYNWAPLGREKDTQAIGRVTGELADLAQTAAAQAAAVPCNGPRAP